MDDRVSRAREYRQKAEELRDEAKTVRSQDSKQLLLCVADDYIHMAERLESSPLKNGATGARSAP